MTASLRVIVVVDGPLVPAAVARALDRVASAPVELLGVRVSAPLAVLSRRVDVAARPPEQTERSSGRHRMRWRPSTSGLGVPACSGGRQPILTTSEAGRTWCWT